MKNAENQNREIEKTPCTNNVHEEICRSENKKTADCVDFWRFSEIPHKHWVSHCVQIMYTNLYKA